MCVPACAAVWNYRRPHTHGSRLPPSLMLFGLALLILLPTLVLLRFSAPHYPSTTDSSSSSRNRFARHSLAGPGAGPAEAAAAAADGGGPALPKLAWET